MNIILGIAIMKETKRGNRREQLLKSAESIFAEKGYDAATTREIVARSGDRLGTLSYHFRAKEDLLQEILTRRSGEMHAKRRAMYEDFSAKRGGSAPTLDEAITSIVAPVIKFAFSGQDGWNDYIIILCRAIHAGGEAQERLTTKLIEPYAKELLGWMKAATPASSHVNVAYAYQFIIAAMLDSGIQSKTDRLKRISEGTASAADADALNDRLIPFLIAGTKAILNV